MFNVIKITECPDCGAKVHKRGHGSYTNPYGDVTEWYVFECGNRISIQKTKAAQCGAKQQ